MTRVPRTAEGWYVLHDFRSVDWRAWRNAPAAVREAAIEEGEAFLRSHEAVEDAADGESAVFSMLGHKADLLVLHFRPTLDDLDLAERRFEGTALAEFTRRSSSYVSVTEVSGYVSDEFFEEGEVDDPGLNRYLQSKLHPSIPDDAYMSFYPMAKRRGPEYNWYDLSFEKRAALMKGHGEVGRTYAGKVTQVIASSLGFDDWEWGITLFAEDPVELKRVVYEMRFDDATSKYADFGAFHVGRRFDPSALGRFMAGEALHDDVTDDVASDEAAGHEAASDGTAGDGTADEAVAASAPSAGGPPAGGPAADAQPADGPPATVAAGGGGDDAGAGAAPAGDPSAGIREQLADLDVYAGKPHGEDVYALVLFSEADPGEFAEAVHGLRANFDHYDSHVETAVYEPAGDDPDREWSAAVASIWDTERAADTASGFLADLPGVVGRAGEADGVGFSTMGMFYTVKPEHREEFVETFGTVGDLLAEMDGHVATDLLVNREDENDTFIASQWADRDAAMGFFRSDEFASTVEWGRDVLADRPRHVFLA